MKKNSIKIIGTLATPLRLNHEWAGERFYRADIAVQRNDKCDVLPIMVPEDLLNEDLNYIGTEVIVNGEVRAWSQKDSEQQRTLVYVHTTMIRAYQGKQVSMGELDGTLVREPYFRAAANGSRLASFTLSVGRFSRGDYIPCVAWNDCAKEAAKLPVGERLHLKGGMQSRTYDKQGGSIHIVEFVVGQLAWGEKIAELEYRESLAKKKVT